MEENRMPCWYYDKQELASTPSIKDGIPYEKEQLLRKKGAIFIRDLSQRLNLTHTTFATAIVFFHRFYMIHSFKAFPLYVTAACSLMLAGKVEETPKKSIDIIRQSKGILSEQSFVQFGEHPVERLMGFERMLLKTIKFDFHLKHPYTFLTQFATRVCCKEADKKTALNECVQKAWTFINDSLETTLCLQWEPEIIACAVFYLATKLSPTQLLIEDWQDRRPGQKWWESFVEGMNSDILQGICHCILDIYQEASSSAPAPTSNQLSGRHSVSSLNLQEPPATAAGDKRRAPASLTHSQSMLNLPVPAKKPNLAEEEFPIFSSTISNKPVNVDASSSKQFIPRVLQPR